MKIPEVLQKYTDVIENYINSPMFFVYDNELINMYSYLSRLTSEELQSVCKDPKYGKMCDLVINERSGVNYKNNPIVQPFVNSKGMINVDGLLPILASFPDIDSALDFMMAVKPGFRYTPEFKKYIEENTQIEKKINIIGDEATIYTFQQYSYEIINEDNFLDIVFKKNGELHRKNGPAIISLSLSDFTLEWYKDGKLHREDGPAKIKYVTECAPGFIRKWRTQRCIKRDSESGEAELEYRQNGEPKHMIITGEGDSIIQYYYLYNEDAFVKYENGKLIYTE